MTKTVLITGASRGFGHAAALAFAKTHHVIALARTSGALEELDDQIQAMGGAATLVPLDIKDDTGLQRLCLSIHERWGGLDAWLHTAVHVPPLSPAPHVDSRDFDKSIAINITATHKLITYIEPLLQPRSGTAIYLDDTQNAGRFFGAYAATKSAQRSLFTSWQAEQADNGAKVEIFEPAPMATATRARFFPGEDRAPLSSTKDQALRLMDVLAK